MPEGSGCAKGCECRASRHAIQTNLNCLQGDLKMFFPFFNGPEHLYDTWGCLVRTRVLRSRFFLIHVALALSWISFKLCSLSVLSLSQRYLEYTKTNERDSGCTTTAIPFLNSWTVFLIWLITKKITTTWAIRTSKTLCTHTDFWNTFP